MPGGQPTFLLPAASVNEVVLRPSSGNDRFIVESGTVAVTGLHTAMENLTLVLSGDAAVTLTREQSFYGVEIDGNARLTLAPGTTTLRDGAIAIAGNGTLDLRGGTLRVGQGDGPTATEMAKAKRKTRPSGNARQRPQSVSIRAS